MPITLKHFRIAFKRSEYIGPEIWKLLETQKFYATELDYLPADEASAGQDSDAEDDSRPRKRPRRQAAQAVTYATEPTSPVASSAAITGRTNMLADSDDSDDGQPFSMSIHNPFFGGAPPKTRTVPMSRDESIARADQIALWIKNLADIMHVEAAQVCESDTAAVFVLISRITDDDKRIVMLPSSPIAESPKERCGTQRTRETCGPDC